MTTTDHRPGHDHALLRYADHGVLLRRDAGVPADAEYCRQWWDASALHSLAMMPDPSP